MSLCFYERAIELDHDNVFLHALYGDALLFNGLYESARNQYDFFLKNASEDKYSTNEWQLKFSCLSTLLSHGYPKEQTRNQSKALDLSGYDDTKNSEAFLENLNKALDYDLLCSLAWFNTAHVHLSKGEHLQCFISFLMSALINRWDITAWLDCTLVCIQLQEVLPLFKYVINTAYFYCGEEYIIKLDEEIDRFNLPGANEFVKLIDDLIEDSKGDTSEIRIIDEKGEFGRIVITH